MSGHPPFLLPQDDGIIDLLQPPDDGDFWSYFKKLHSQFGVLEGKLDIFKRNPKLVINYICTLQRDTEVTLMSMFCILR